MGVWTLQKWGKCKNKDVRRTKKEQPDRQKFSTLAPHQGLLRKVFAGQAALFSVLEINYS
ncbi:MAG: hypothetical protein EGQ17_01690 [Lachnospiraceae bacterium]|nr:hypothetical protein [Lachnospiraceae bacterium]